jgi:Lrp/AsnC family leucine-responsive transcriptional regulator
MNTRPTPVTLDRIDLKILDVLQEDGRITNRDLAAKVALSPSACLARVRQLESAGVISGYRATLSIEMIRAAIVVFAQITLRRHLTNTFDKFDATLCGFPEVVEAARVSGPFDYILKIVVADISEWREFAEKLLDEDNGVEKMVSHFLVREAKAFSGYPVKSAPTRGLKR